MLLSSEMAIGCYLIPFWYINNRALRPGGLTKDGPRSEVPYVGG